MPANSLLVMARRDDLIKALETAIQDPFTVWTLSRLRYAKGGLKDAQRLSSLRIQRVSRYLGSGSKDRGISYGSIAIIIRVH